MQTQYGKWFKKEMSIEIGHKWVISSGGCYNPVGVKKMTTKSCQFLWRMEVHSALTRLFFDHCFFKYKILLKVPVATRAKFSATPLFDIIFSMNSHIITTYSSQNDFSTK